MQQSRQLMQVLVALALISSTAAHARVFSRCQLSRELLRYNFPRMLIPSWVCLIEHASGRTVDKISHHNDSHSSYGSYGLFQINSKDWCKKGRKGGQCNVRCEDLLNDDLTDDVRCAKRVYDRIGFKGGWPASYAYCRDKSLPDLSRC